MGWLEQIARRYEHYRWTVDDNRRSLPFEWGLEHVGGPAGSDGEARAFLDRWVEQTLARSDQWYATTPAADYALSDSLLTFTSQVRSPFPENDTVHARFFPAKRSGPAVVVIPHWNAKPSAYVDVCRWLNALGLTALRMSLPYHDRRAVPGHERADHLVGPNLGLTLQANQQAVSDVRRCLRWLERQGYTRLGLLGTSIGSSIGFITMAHDRAVRASAFLHVSTYFGDVVRTGLTTMHVWESLRAKVTGDEIRRYWAPISPFPYLHKLRGTGQRCLMISARYDASFWPEFSMQVRNAVRNNGIACETLLLPCGHYSIDQAPFKHIAGFRFGMFLFDALA